MKNEADYLRRREAREARRREIEEAAGWSALRRAGKGARKKPGRRRTPQHVFGTTKGVTGNTVQGHWRRNNSGAWSRS